MSANLNPLKPIYNIGDNVYFSLYENIITMDMKPGEILNINDIADQLQISRSPVRDALMRLSKEGLVDIIPQKGTNVSKIDLSRVEEERFLRGSLEEKVLIDFAELWKPEDIIQLENNIRAQREAMDRSDFVALLNRDDEFHQVFFERTQKQMCWEIIHSMSGHYRRIRLMSFWSNHIASNVIAEHEALLQALKSKNITEVLRVYKIHSSQLLSQEEEFITQYPEYFRLPLKGGMK